MNATIWYLATSLIGVLGICAMGFSYRVGYRAGEVTHPGMSRLRALTNDPERIKARLHDAAVLEAVCASQCVVETAARVAGSGRVTLEDVLRLREDGIEVDGMIRAIRGEQP